MKDIFIRVMAKKKILDVEGDLDSMIKTLTDLKQTMGGSSAAYKTMKEESDDIDM